jgi:hypothetical protein
MASLHPDWITDGKGRKSWPVDHYQVEGPRSTNWLSDGVIKQHRTLGTLLNLLIAKTGLSSTTSMNGGRRRKTCRTFRRSPMNSTVR